jgi:hypothetical protein
MKRQDLIWTAAFTGILTAMLSAPAAVAEPTTPDPAPSTTASPLPLTPVDGSTLVPGMAMGAKVGGPCDGKPFFGLGSDGYVLACVYAGDDVRSWENSAPLVGVRIKGSACSAEGDYVAMSPEGEGMICVPSAVGVSEAPVWTPDS